MQLLSNKVIYHNGQHNAFTSMVCWKDKYLGGFQTRRYSQIPRRPDYGHEFSRSGNLV